MNEKQSQSNVIVNTFERMWKDALPSTQSRKTYVEAWNAVNTSDEESSYGISNEPSNELFVSIPGDVRGLIYVEERDQFIVFVENKGVGEIGIIDEKHKNYSKVTTTDIANDLGVCQKEWIDAEVKVKEPCGDLWLYWSSNDIYKKINLDDPCCKFEELELIERVCVQTPKTSLVEKAGELPNGTYLFAGKARDKEGNDSNWSLISNPISVSEGDNRAGELSSHAIEITVEGGSNEYHLLDLAVIRNIGGVKSIEQFATISSSNSSNSFNYLYRGKTGEEFPILLSTILTRTNRYIRGKNLVQYDNRIVLYNLKNEFNLDYQRQANNITAKYDTYLVPIEEAHKYKGMRSNENYQPAIRWRYDDGTYSDDFLIPAPKGSNDECDVYVDNSVRTEVHIELDNKDWEQNPNVQNHTPHTIEDSTTHESSGIEWSEGDDPTIEGIIGQEIDHASQQSEGQLDCLCGRAEYIQSRGPGAEWEMDDDVIGAVRLSEILCMCKNRNDTYADPVPPNEEPKFPRKDTIGGRATFEEAGLTSEQIDEAILALGGELPEEADFTTQTGDVNIFKRSFNHIKNKIKKTDEAIKSESKRLSPEVDKSKKVVQGGRCYVEGYNTCIGNMCYTCEGGLWNYINNGDSYGVGGGGGFNNDGGSIENHNLGFEPIYDTDGCTIIGYKPKKYTSGNFGSWEIQERYPMTLDANCDFIYGDLAGEKIRLHKVPSLAKEPNFISFSSGVPNRFAQSNSEFKDTYAIMIGPSFSNITLPKNPPKPLCKHTPYLITYVERTEGNKTVIGSGVGHSCFKGQTGGDEFVAFSKHAANSFERFDRSIEPPGQPTFRGGTAIDDVGAYFIHSPDFHMRRPGLSATHCLIEMELTGKGFRHGMFAKGEKPESTKQDTVHQKGTRQSINLNHYNNLSEPILREVNDMSYVPADSVMSKSGDFKYALSNVNREAGVYTELDGTIETFKSGQDLDGLYGGSDTSGDGASDTSFMGDTYTEAIGIHDARAHVLTFIRKLPNQYGSPINQAYIPLGLECAGGFKDSVEGLVGDSFVSHFSYKRTALISDKTNRIISRFLAVGGFSGGSIILYIFGLLMAQLFRVLNIRNGGYIPKSQDGSDFIRIFGGLRFINGGVTTSSGNVSNPGQTSGDSPIPTPMVNAPSLTVGQFTDYNAGDNYFPQNLKTQITTVLSSDVNGTYREIGAKDVGDLVYTSDASTLKGLKIDSSMPEDSQWDEGWLNRWYSVWKENARWKLWVQAIVTFVFTYGIGLFMILRGLSDVTNGLSAIGGGTFMLRTIGAIISAIIGIIIIALGVVWIRYWVATDSDNKFIEEMLSLKNIRPDRKNADGSYSFDENRLRQFETNHWAYDNTHSEPNMLAVGYGMSDPYDTRDCDVYTNKIVYSNRQNSQSQVDAWANFKPNDSLEIPMDTGQLQKMFRLGGTLYAHTSDMLIKLHRGGSGHSLTENNVLLGSGDLFSVAMPIYGGVVEGYAGLLDPNAAEVSAFGYTFPDREARKWYMFNGGGLPSPISNMGVKHFMDENMTLHLVNAYPNFKLVDVKSEQGVGFSFGVDHENNRLLFTKVDYKPLDGNIKMSDDGVSFELDGEKVSIKDKSFFSNESFTLSYDLRTKGWVSYHNYTPHIYAWNRFDMYSFDPSGVWKHNVKGRFQTFYDQWYPFSVEYAVNEVQRGDAFVYNSTTIGTEAYKWKDVDYVNSINTFNEMVCYNSHQCTGNQTFLDSDNLSISDRSMEHTDKVNIKYQDRIWSFKDVADYLIDTDEFILDQKTEVGPRPINKNNISTDIKNNLFYDNYLVNRLIFSNFEDIKLILKRVDTNITYKSR